MSRYTPRRDPYEDHGKKIVALEQKFEQTSSAIKEIRDMISARDEKLDKLFEKQKPNLNWIWQALSIVLAILALLLGLIITPIKSDMNDMERKYELFSDKVFSMQVKDVEFRGSADSELKSLQKEIDEIKGRK